jgi:hypothetical protein
VIYDHVGNVDIEVALVLDIILFVPPLPQIIDPLEELISKSICSPTPELIVSVIRVPRGGGLIYPVPYITILGPPLENLVVVYIELLALLNPGIIFPPTYIILDPPVVVIGVPDDNIREPCIRSKRVLRLEREVFFAKYTSLDILNEAIPGDPPPPKRKAFHMLVVLPLIFNLHVPAPLDPP